MKKQLLHLTCVVLPAFMLLSCQKDFSLQQAPKQQLLALNVSKNPNPKIFIYRNEDKWTVTDSNTCTHEWVTVNLDITTRLTQQTKDDTIFYHYETDNAGTRGVGLTTGNKYVGAGHTNDNFKAYLSNGQYIIIGTEKVTDVVTFATPGPKNNLSSKAFYRIQMDASGNVTFVRDYFKFDYCK